MSAKERDRLKVLHEVNKRDIYAEAGAAELGLSVRWVRKLLVRQQRRGDGALRHGLRGRASNRKTPEAVKWRAVELYRKKKQAKLWHDYGPTLAAEVHQNLLFSSKSLLRQRRRGRVDRLVERSSDISVSDREEPKALPVDVAGGGVIANVATTALGNPRKRHWASQTVGGVPGAPAVLGRDES